MKSVQRFARNKQGRDFVIGDINGHFNAVNELMEKVGFDESVDRIFTTGNLLGEESPHEDILEFLERPFKSSFPCLMNRVRCAPMNSIF